MQQHSPPIQTQMEHHVKDEKGIVFGKLLGEGEDFTIVDTPGFGHTDNGNTIFDEVWQIMKQNIKISIYVR